MEWIPDNQDIFFVNWSCGVSLKILKHTSHLRFPPCHQCEAVFKKKDRGEHAPTPDIPHDRPLFKSLKQIKGLRDQTNQWIIQQDDSLSFISSHISLEWKLRKAAVASCGDWVEGLLGTASDSHGELSTACGSFWLLLMAFGCRRLGWDSCKKADHRKVKSSAWFAF